jgi:hypothetical protein
VPVTGRLAATLEGYIAAAHPAPETSDHVFYSVAPGRPVNQSTVYLRFRVQRGKLPLKGLPEDATTAPWSQPRAAGNPLARPRMNAHAPRQLNGTAIIHAQDSVPRWARTVKLGPASQLFFCM